MDSFRKQLLEKSGIENVLKSIGVKPNIHVAESKNLTLFIGFEGSGKRELFQRINDTNSLAYDLIEDFSKNIYRKMSNVITLSGILERNKFIKLIIVYKCSDLDIPDHSILKMLQKIHYFLRNIIFYTKGVGLLLDDRTCESKVLYELRKNKDANSVLANVLLARVDFFTSDFKTFINDQLFFEPIYARNFKLQTFRLIQESFFEFRNHLEGRYSNLLDISLGPILSQINFSRPLEPQTERSARRLEKFVEMSSKFDLNVTKQFLSELSAVDVVTPTIELELNKFKDLQQKMGRIFNCLEKTGKKYVFNYILDDYYKDIVKKQLDSNVTKCGNAELLKRVIEYHKNFKYVQEVKYAKFEDTVYELPDLSNIKEAYVTNRVASMVDQVEQAVEKLAIEGIATQLGHYLNDFSEKLKTKPMSNERVFELAQNWRENSKNMLPLTQNCFLKKPIVEWYSDLFKPLANDTWLENLTDYESILRQMHTLKDVNPYDADSCWRDEFLGAMNPAIESYQTQVNILYRDLRRNVTINVVQTIMEESMLRVDSIIRNLNPMLTEVLIGRLFGEVRATEKEIEQQKRILAKQHHAKVDYEKFMRTFETFTRVFDIPLPDTEWGKLQALQAEFDKVSDLSSELWILPKVTKHNWGRELLVTREILYDATSVASLTPSFINNAAKWTTAKVGSIQELVTSDIWIIKRETTITLLDGMLVFLDLMVRKLWK